MCAYVYLNNFNVSGYVIEVFEGVVTCQSDHWGATLTTANKFTTAGYGAYHRMNKNSLTTNIHTHIQVKYMLCARRFYKLLQEKKNLLLIVSFLIVSQNFLLFMFHAFIHSPPPLILTTTCIKYTCFIKL